MTSKISIPGPRPRFTILIKGLINTGKSTLFNAVMTNNYSATSMRRKTMCQVILTENNQNATTFDSLRDTIEKINDQFYKQTEQGQSIDELPEIVSNIPIIESFLPRINGVDYRFVETVGFDDPKTDVANHKWFVENTRYSDVLLFITDKEKCMNTFTEQNLLKETLKDLKKVQTYGKTIPLIVIINKVEEGDDPEIKAMIHQCRSNIDRILREEGIPDYPVEYAEISAMTAYFYRLFLSTNSFQGMEQKDIVKLGEIELGREGKQLAKDPSQHAILAQKIKERIDQDETGVKWQQECGLDSLVNGIYLFISLLFFNNIYHL
jgi:GTPase SAR1 family protein